MDAENVSKALADLGKRLIVAAASMVSPIAGVAVSAAFLATWLIKRKRGKVDPIEKEIEIVVELGRKLEERRRRLEELRKALEKADSVTKPIIEYSLSMVEKEVRELEEEYQLHQLRILAYNRIKSLGDEKLLKEFEKILKKIEKGKHEEIADHEVEILRKLEEMWRRRDIEYSVLAKLLTE